VMIIFPANVSCSSSAPFGSSDHMLLNVNISSDSQRATSTPVNLAVHSGRLAKTASIHLSS